MVINPKSHKEKFLRIIIEKLDTDILFECFVGLLIGGDKIDHSNVHVIPNGNHRRSYRNDIVLAPPVEIDDEDQEDAVPQFQAEHYFEESESGSLTLYTSRSAILDYIPEDFYTEPDNVDEFITEAGEERTKEGIENYRKKEEAQVKSAHRFFKPIEIEYNKVRIQREFAELNQVGNFDKTISHFWREFNVSNDKWKRFVRTLHLVPYVIGDKDKTKSLIEFVLGTNISLSFEIDECYKMSDAEQEAFMGTEKILGYNVSLGNTIYDYHEMCILKIENLSEVQFYEYFDEKSEDRKLLEELIKFYFPLNIEVRLDFSIKIPEKTTSQNDDFAIPILGYSSILVE